VLGGGNKESSEVSGLGSTTFAVDNKLQIFLKPLSSI